MISIHKLLLGIARMHRKGHDTLIVVCGGEGIGKSNFTLDVNEDWCKLMEEKEDIKLVALSQGQFTEALENAKEKIGCVVYDEAGDGLFSRDGMTDFNKDLVKLFQVVRAKGLMVIMVLPNFWYLEKYFRESRIKHLFFVMKRGRVAYWNRRQIDQILRENAHNPLRLNSDLLKVRPSMMVSFPIYQGELIEAYKAKKAAKVSESLSEAKKKYGSPEQQLSKDDRFIIEQLRKNIPMEKIGGSLHITKQAVSSRVRTFRNKGIEVFVKSQKSSEDF